MMSTTPLKGAHLSLQQDRLWQFQQQGGAYRSQCTLSIKGTFDYALLQKSLQHLVEQHTIFQTLFYPLPGMDRPIQVMGHQIDLSCPIIDLEELAETKQSIILHSLLHFLQEEPFDEAHGPLFRSALFWLSAETASLFIGLSAFCSDASTLPLLINALMKQYDTYLSGQALTSEPLQYAAVSAWQNQLLLKGREKTKAAYEFWQNFDLSQMTRMQQLLEQNGVRKQSNLRTTQKAIFEPFTLPLKMEEGTSIDIRALAFFYDVSPQAVLLACWLILLWRLTDEPQLVIGVACNGRTYEALTKALGPYTRFVPFNAYLKENWTFKQVLALVEPLLKKTIKYQSHFNWPAMPDSQNDSVDPDFFPVAFEHEYWPTSFTGEQLSLSLEQRSSCMEPFTLKLSVLQLEDHLQLELHYDSQSVTSTCVTRLASMLQVLLSTIVEQPEATMSTLTFLTDDEQNHLLSLFSAPTRLPSCQVVHRLFEAHVKRMPNQLAVMSAKEHLTYQQLNEQANQLAWVLRKRGIGPNVVMGLCMPRTARMLIGLLGILKAGGAYLPLDSSNPPARLLYQLQKSQAVVLLTQQEMSTCLPEWEGRTIYLEELEQEMSQASVDDLPGGSEAEDLAYIIYTSGSTGMPKGVMIQQSSVVSYTQALCEQLKAEPGWQYATVSTLAADLGNTAIFCGLASGGCVQVLDYETVTSAEAMAQWMKLHPMDILKIVPSHLSALLTEGHGKELLPQRALVLGGEALPISLLKQIRESGSPCEVYNHYGPTETTIGVLVNPLGVLKIQEGQEETYGAIPLGRPITNAEVYVLDQQMQVVPIGVTGELYIGGSGLAMGYIQQSERTAERFVPHPYSKRAGARLYRTGDLARYNEEGTIDFVGRRDNQVKLRGYRIELAEIEALLRQHPNVRDTAVVVQEDTSGAIHLVGYIVPRKLPLPATLELQNFLSQHLPEYMVCTAFVYLKSLPLTVNGKVDRHHLITPDTDNSLAYLIDAESPSRKVVQPRNTVELQLVQIWEDLLERQPISITDNFFQLGGHSLLAVRLISRLSKQFERNLDMAILFQHPTIAELAVALRQQVSSQEKVLIAIQPHGTRPPFFCIHPSGGTVFCYIDLARLLGQDQPFYGLQNPDGEILDTLEELAAFYITTIKTVQPQGPYLLGGWSLGGMIAFEMAQQLQKQGDEVSVLAIFDSVPSHPQRRANAIEKGIDLGDAGVVKEFLATSEVTLPEDVAQGEPEEQIGYLMNYLIKTNAIPADTSLELVRRYFCTMILNEHLSSLYIPHTYDQKIDYFAAENSLRLPEIGDEEKALAENSEHKSLLECWQELAKGGIELHQIPGDHQNIIEEPNVQILANALKHCIDRVCGHIDE